MLGMKPSYEELFEMVQLLSKANFELQEENKCLQKRINELEERLNLNSQNSSKPPSSDQKKNKKAPKGGAIKGHPGYFRKLQSHVDITVKVSLSECEHCGSRNLKKKSSQIWQQIELPEIKPLVTQIECEKATCLECKRNVVAPYPKGHDRSCFGPKLIGFIGACSSVYRMSKRTIQTLLKTLMGVDMSLGSIPAMEKKVSSGLAPSFEALAKRVNDCRVAYVDETSFRRSAQTHYVWTATTKNEALIRRTFKHFYLRHVKSVLKPLFPTLVGYPRFVQMIPEVFFPMFCFVKEHQGISEGIHFVDSTVLTKLPYQTRFITQDFQRSGKMGQDHGRMVFWIQATLGD
jgi:hypothetical protein